MLSQLTALDLFSGAGGMTSGLKAAGFRVLAGIEVDSVAAETFQVNHPDIPVIQADIREIQPAEALQVNRFEKGILTLLAACPPCQGFSTIRTRNSYSHVEDDRNDLVLEVLRFTRALRPLVVLMENVPGLRRDSRLDKLQASLEIEGYSLQGSPRILNVSDYGIPQNRRRLVLIASRIGRVPFPEPLSPKRTVRDTIGHLAPPGKTGDRLHDLPERRSEHVKRIIAAVPKDGGGRLDIPRHLRLDCHVNFEGFKDVYGRMAWDKPAPTITGGCHNPSKGRYLHPDQDRNITLREAALLQSFPAGYWFSLARGKAHVASMIGNALPPPFVEAHARNIAGAVRS
jgi:DNA (cytosine-5)-methyltransferase 1